MGKWAGAAVVVRRGREPALEKREDRAPETAPRIVRIVL